MTSNPNRKIYFFDLQYFIYIFISFFQTANLHIFIFFRTFAFYFLTFIRMNNEIILKEVLNKRDLTAFIRFPRSLYRTSPYYVPALEEDERKTLTKHPALAFCDLRLWLAFLNGKPVGRIAGIINRKCNELKNQQRIRFGWFDVIDDQKVAKALMNEVEMWGRSENMTEISGPSRFSNMEKQGMLVMGFDKMPSISSEYNYEYYPQFIEQLGFQKEVDYIQYKVKVNEVPERLKLLNEVIQKKYKVHIKNFSLTKELTKYGKDFFEALNRSFASLYNFIPLNEEEIDYHIKNNLAFADKDLVNLLVDEQDKMVGFSFCLPSLSKAFRKSKGRLYPCGWWHILRALKKNDIVDLYLTGVLPEWMNTGIHTLYHCQLNEIFIKKGYRYAITNPQLEHNPANRIWEKYEAEIVFRRRCYCKELGV